MIVFDLMDGDEQSIEKVPNWSDNWILAELERESRYDLGGVIPLGFS